MALATVTFYKRADWVRNYYLDLSGYYEFTQTPAQTITGASIAAVTGITFGAPQIQGTEVVWSTSGGTAGTAYTAEMTVTTSGGSTLTFLVVFLVVP